MKKALALTLALLMVLALAACGGNTDGQETEATSDASMTKEELLASATEITSEQMAELEKNVAKGLPYKDTNVIIFGIVDAIHTDGCDIAPFYASNGRDVYGPDFLILHASLGVDELVALEKYQSIKVVGHISDIGEESTSLSAVAGTPDMDLEALMGNTTNRIAITMDNAYIVETVK